jgi:pimeloyl-ACP methyl ester carboxylesterase
MFCEEDGIPVLAYDPAIAQSLDEERVDVAPPDLWPVFERCASKPMLLIRGADSDILAPACVARMRDCHDALQVAEIPRRGHAPTLTERTSLVAIDAFLSGR